MTRRGLCSTLLFIGVVAITCLAVACSSSKPTNNKANSRNVSANNKASSSPSTKTAPKPSSSVSNGISSAQHAANCKKLGLEPSTNDNTKLYAECASWMGSPYKYGGSTKQGTDCSGFTSSVYKAVYGKTLTRQSAGMLNDNCTRIKKEELREGDLVFFRTDGKRSSVPNHVGIYLKDDKFIHASTSKGVVVSSLKQDYYAKNWITGGRVKP